MHSKSESSDVPERPGGWRAGDVVLVSGPTGDALGEGRVVDIQDAQGGGVRALLVRFQGGPRAGAWYSPGSLHLLRDLEGRPVGQDAPAAPRLQPKSTPPHAAPPTDPEDQTPLPVPERPQAPKPRAPRPSRPQQALVANLKPSSRATEWKRGDLLRLGLATGEVATGRLLALQGQRGQPCEPNSARWVQVRLEGGETVTRWHESLELSAPREETLGERVQCTFSGKVGTIVPLPPRAAGEPWAAGWVRVEWDKGDPENRHVSHLRLDSPRSEVS